MLSSQAVSQTTLLAGDLLVAGYNYDGADQVKVLTMVSLASGTTFKITDNGWNGSALTTTEGTHTYTASSAVSAGTVITVNTSNTNFSTSGDQIIIYQGSGTSPTFISALSTKLWVTGSITSNTSRLPLGLVSGASAIAFAIEKDDGYYNIVSNSGTKAQLQNVVCNTSNWFTTDSRISTFPSWTFSIAGSLPTEPTSPSNIIFSNYTTWKTTVSFTPSAGGAAGYLVLRKVGSMPIAQPVDMSTYQQGDYIGDAQVAYVGSATTYLQRSLYASNTYHFSVYAYNGSGATTNYNQINSAIASFTTPDNGIGTYYASVDPLATSFVTDLQSRIRLPYTKVDYAQFDETYVANFSSKDAPTGQKMVECVYSGQQYSYTEPFAWTPITPFSREHTFCHSWMPTYPSESGYEYADQHHLFPVNQNSANAVRSNHPLGEVVTVTSSYLDGKLGLDAAGNTVYEPREAQKGDAARALMYMSMRYDGVNGNNWTFDWLNNTKLPALSEDAQDVNLLMAWHITDEPDTYEISRNDFIQSIQQNRNPFVDHPEYVNYIDMNNLDYVAPPAMSEEFNESLMEKNEQKTEASTSEFDALVYPIPTQGNVNIELNQPSDGAIILSWYDMTGKLVKQENHTGDQLKYLMTDASELTDGLYLLNIHSSTQQLTVRWTKG
ncbi:MAG: endonuclease [Flavobacteriales bacterium]